MGARADASDHSAMVQVRLKQRKVTHAKELGNSGIQSTSGVFYFLPTNNGAERVLAQESP